MYLLVTDETNLTPSDKRRFFVYGGLLFPVERLVDLDREIEAIRQESGYCPEDQLKFDTHARPDHVSFDVATEAKRAVIQVCQDLDCRFIAYVIHHEILKNQDLEATLNSALNHVIGRFNRFLEGEDDHGMCAVDHLPIKEGARFLAEKFIRGLDFEHGRTIPLDRIKLFASTTLGASHANSAMDVVLGTFRYCINDPENVEAAQEMMASVVPLMWHTRTEDRLFLRERGLILRPKTVKVPKYREEYSQLLDDVKALFWAGTRGDGV